MKRTRKAITRLIAVAAVIAAFIAVYVVVMHGKNEIDKNNGKNHASKQQGKSKGKKKPAKPPAKTPATYVVKEGDTLGAIAAKTGVKVREIEKLNPEIDPQSLSVGAKLKLR